MKKLRIAIIGFGKIAEDEHVPSIAGNDRFELVATAGSRASGLPEVQSFGRHPELLASVKDLDAVAICTPPAVRYAIARDCVEAGLHVLLEKPPAMTMSEIEDLACLSSGRDTTLFTTWHSQYNPAVDAAAEALAGKTIRSMRIDWREDVRKWHPGQDWIWEAGGFGVFDPGVNALSIATRIFPGPLFVRDAELDVPSNKQMPIAVRMIFSSPVSDGELKADFDFREKDREIWTITVETEDGTQLRLVRGGSALEVNGEETVTAERAEYPRIYRRFADLIDERRSLVEIAPMRLAADAFLIGRRFSVEEFLD